ncbi:RabGAP/TBC [Cryphonectria parasitica EP155]|uniref:RabGAP/TBC n=1 Tax=Cryphonectria parasitica (strain ATCC 38755 / EP155) TaxID=660469 RepID=A0A9P4Y7T7_CRYP1|nr:RabGAP/TBC [Cryphonectria parasitica EP155]KAF3768014.1 RabGAP/TBC [Cryphonectria parasitica EP155]
MAEADRPPSLERNDVLDEKNGIDATDTSSPAADGTVTEDSPQTRETSPKEALILDACGRRDISELQALAELPGGFITDDLRQEAWPILLGLPIRTRTDGDEKAHEAYLSQEDLSWKHLPPHKDEDQVRLDVDRAFVYYPHYRTDDERNRQKAHLSNVILSVLRRHPYLCYFQGYHDIAQVFLLVLPPALRAPAVTRLSTLRIRDFMLPNLTAALAQLRLIPSILNAADPKLCAHLSQTEPFFALSGTLTMYAHDIQSLGEIARLFDVLLAREPIFSVYMFAQIVLNRRTELFETPPTEPEMLHSILSKLPQPLDLEALITATSELCARYPPETLGAAWRRGISEFSALKTARSTADCAGQSEAVGEYYFTQHVRDLERRERRAQVVKALWAYSRPAGMVGFAVLFGVLAYWMRRSPLVSSSLAGFSE